MAGLRKAVASGIAGLFVLAGNAFGQDAARIAKDADAGATMCATTKEAMLAAYPLSTQFSRYDKPTDKVYFSEMRGGKRVEYNVTEEQFGKLAMEASAYLSGRATGLAASVGKAPASSPDKGKTVVPECPGKFWLGQAIVYANEKF